MVIFRMEDDQYLNHENEKPASDSLSSIDRKNEEEKIPNNSVNMNIIYQLLHLLSILFSVY